MRVNPLSVLALFGLSACAAPHQYFYYSNSARLVALRAEDFPGSYEADLNIGESGYCHIEIRTDGTAKWEGNGFTGGIVDFGDGFGEPAVFSISCLGRWEQIGPGEFQLRFEEIDVGADNVFRCVCISSTNRRGFVLLKFGGALDKQLVNSRGKMWIFFKAQTNQTADRTSRSRTVNREVHSGLESADGVGHLDVGQGK